MIFEECCWVSPNTANFSFITDYFGKRIITLDSKMKAGNGMDRPLYSPDLMQLLLIGTFESKVCLTQPLTLDDLEIVIQREVISIRPDILEKRIHCFESKLLRAIFFFKRKSSSKYLMLNIFIIHNISFKLSDF